jgi:hypothetical protein
MPRHLFGAATQPDRVNPDREDGESPDRLPMRLTEIREHEFGEAEARHLLLRAGFGGTPRQIETLASWGPARSVDYLLAAEEVPYATPAADRFDANIMRPMSRVGAARLPRRPAASRRGHARAVPPAAAAAAAAGPPADRRHPAVVARAHDRDAPPARREDDALLAQPLRDELPHDRELVPHVPAEPVPARERAGLVRGPAVRDHPRPRDDRLPRQQRLARRAAPTRTSRASSWSCSAWASATTPSTTSRRAPAPSPGTRSGTTSSSSTTRTTTRATRTSWVGAATSTARGSSARSSPAPRARSSSRPSSTTSSPSTPAPSTRRTRSPCDA